MPTRIQPGYRHKQANEVQLFVHLRKLSADEAVELLEKVANTIKYSDTITMPFSDELAEEFIEDNVYWI